MNQAIKEMFDDFLSIGSILVETSNNVNWDLAHYIADNIIAKIVMVS